MVRLHVEDELVLGPALLKGLGVVNLVGRNFVAVAIDLVSAKSAAAMPLPLRRKSRRERPWRFAAPLADRRQPVLVLLLLGRLRRRDELLVGGDSRRDRRQEFVFRVEITFTYPHR